MQNSSLASHPYHVSFVQILAHGPGVALRRPLGKEVAEQDKVKTEGAVPRSGFLQGAHLPRLLLPGESEGVSSFCELTLVLKLPHSCVAADGSQ